MARFLIRVVFLPLILITASGGVVATAQRVLRGQPIPSRQPEIQTSGCPAEGATSVPARAQAGDYVELKRTICFGACPVYTVRVQEDGHVTWQGERSVQVIGTDTATIQPSDARSLIEKFRTPAFWNLCSRYGMSASDGATVIT